MKIANTLGARPKTFEIDCLVKAKKIQETLETLYLGVGGKYYYGDLAWNYIQDYTGINLMEILEKIATTRR